MRRQCLAGARVLGCSSFRGETCSPELDTPEVFPEIYNYVYPGFEIMETMNVPISRQDLLGGRDS